jgi:hypothetical protein
MKTKTRNLILFSIGLLGLVGLSQRVFAVEEVKRYKTSLCMTPTSNYEVGSWCRDLDKDGPCDRTSSCVANPN